jgi:hypothetical protein
MRNIKINPQHRYWEMYSTFDMYILGKIQTKLIVNNSSSASGAYFLSKSLIE